MKKTLIFIIILLLLSGCVKSNGTKQTTTAQTTISQTTTSGTPDPIKEKISKMTPQEKIGQMVFAGVDKYTNDSNGAMLIEKYRVGGFILLQQNVKDTAQVTALLNSLKRTNAGNIPLFLGVDEEGGRITRMPAEFTRLPTNEEIGKVNNSDFSYEVGKMLGTEVKALGYNMDFAPVLDINSNPNNQVIGNRSFGNSPELVSKLGVQTLNGIKSQNIISVVKHFPGHGDTSVDSHTGLPIVNNNLERLKSFELIPFKEAINSGADIVMVAHILFPNIDPDNPATMSRKIISDVLKGELNFKGVVITDDMTMGAITQNYDIGAAAVKSVLAGSDIVLVCHDINKETAVLNALKNAVTDGTIPIETVNESVYKILKLKEKYHLADTAVGAVDVKGINDMINNLLNK